MAAEDYVEWEREDWEDGSFERFIVRADKAPDGWVFSERSTMDLCIVWYPLSPTPELVARAEQEWAELAGIAGECERPGEMSTERAVAMLA